MFKLLSPMTLNRNVAPWRLLAATTLIALAAGAAQTVFAAPGGMGGHGGGAGGHGGPGGHADMAFSPRHIERLLDSVNATADQRAQIAKIVEAARADLQSQRAASRALHQQSSALFAQPSVDARAAETLRQQMLAQHDLVSKRMLQVKLDVSRILTPEQRKTLTDRMQSRRSLMERHRMEREALDKPRT